MSSHKIMWQAICELGDYFSRLGGAARFSGMRESEIFLFVACRSVDIVEGTDYVSKFVSPEFIFAGKNVIPKVNERLQQLPSRSIDIRRIVADFVTHYDQKLENERTPQWIEFIREAKEYAV